MGNMYYQELWELQEVIKYREGILRELVDGSESSLVSE